MLNSPEPVILQDFNHQVLGKLSNLKPYGSYRNPPWNTHYEPSKSQMNSYGRTIRTMKKLKLIIDDPIQGVSSLTEKGRLLGAKIDREAKSVIEDFSPLPQVANDLIRIKREKKEFDNWLETYEQEERERLRAGQRTIDPKYAGRTLWDIYKEKRVEDQK
jgi:DNA mismatch repair ATPase MutS